MGTFPGVHALAKPWHASPLGHDARRRNFGQLTPRASSAKSFFYWNPEERVSSFPSSGVGGAPLLLFSPWCGRAKPRPGRRACKQSPAPVPTSSNTTTTGVLSAKSDSPTMQERSCDHALQSDLMLDTRVPDVEIYAYAHLKPCNRDLFVACGKLLNYGLLPGTSA